MHISGYTSWCRICSTHACMSGSAHLCDACALMRECVHSKAYTPASSSEGIIQYSSISESDWNSLSLSRARTVCLFVHTWFVSNIHPFVVFVHIVDTHTHTGCWRRRTQRTPGPKDIGERYPARTEPHRALSTALHGHG